MRNGLVHLGAWAAATGAAVALSWFGVHAVLVDAAFDQPQALPLLSAAVRTPSLSSSSPSPQTEAATPRPTGPGASPSATTQSPPPSPSGPPSLPQPSAGGAPMAAARSTAAASVHSYLVPGGRVALDMKSDSAQLVSATPDSGWQMQFWQGDQWMRFDFTRDSSTNSVFVTWNGHPPDVQTVVR